MCHKAKGSLGQGQAQPLPVLVSCCTLHAGLLICIARGAQTRLQSPVVVRRQPSDNKMIPGKPQRNSGLAEQPSPHTQARNAKAEAE
jgi:hypothetical protein